MKALLGDTVIAQAPRHELILIEGNWYFPPSSVNAELLVESSTPYTCSWKGECQYYSVKRGGVLLQDRAWSYPAPIPASVERVGTDYSGYVAFSKEITVVD